MARMLMIFELSNGSLLKYRDGLPDLEYSATRDNAFPRSGIDFFHCLISAQIMPRITYNSAFVGSAAMRSVNWLIISSSLVCEKVEVVNRQQKNSRILLRIKKRDKVYPYPALKYKIILELFIGRLT